MFYRVYTRIIFPYSLLTTCKYNLYIYVYMECPKPCQYTSGSRYEDMQLFPSRTYSEKSASLGLAAVGLKMLISFYYP